MQSTVQCRRYEQCWKIHYKTQSGKEQVKKGCLSNLGCSIAPEACEANDSSRFSWLKGEIITECVQSCCVTDGDTLCNGAFIISASINTLLMIFAIFYNLILL